MKKLIFLAIAIFAFSLSYAQQFGVKAGFNSTSFAVTFMDESDSDASNGFYLGVLADFEISEGLNLQPELQYVNISEDGESTGFLNLPVMFKYYIAEGFNVQAGPQISYLLEEAEDDFSNLGIDLAVGLGYDIDDNFFVDARYSYNLNNRYTGEGSDDFSIRFNAFQVGVGYKFN